MNFDRCLDVDAAVQAPGDVELAVSIHPVDGRTVPARLSGRRASRERQQRAFATQALDKPLDRPCYRLVVEDPRDQKVRRRNDIIGAAVLPRGRAPYWMGARALLQLLAGSRAVPLVSIPL